MSYRLKAIDIVAIITAVLFVAVVTLLSTTTASANGQDKVSICHRTASESNPYVFITVANPAKVQAHLSGEGKGHFDTRVGGDYLAEDFEIEQGYCGEGPPPPLPDLSTTLACANGTVAQTITTDIRGTVNWVTYIDGQRRSGFVEDTRGFTHWFGRLPFGPFPVWYSVQQGGSYIQGSTTLNCVSPPPPPPPPPFDPPTAGPGGGGQSADILICGDPRALIRLRNTSDEPAVFVVRFVSARTKQAVVKRIRVRPNTTRVIKRWVQGGTRVVVRSDGLLLDATRVNRRNNVGACPR